MTLLPQQPLGSQPIILAGELLLSLWKPRGCSPRPGPSLIGWVICLWAGHFCPSQGLSLGSA